MSDYNNEFRLIKNKIRSKKLNHRVDLTAMVSISFLLIVFYLVTIELSKPKALNLGMPSCIDYGRITCHGCYRTDRITTLLLDDNNKIISYKGLAIFPDEKPKVLRYGKNSIRKELLNTNYKLNALYGKYKGAIVIIKPSKNSTFGNLVDILDEMAIADIPTYAIVNDLTPEDTKLIASN
ncbi:MAG: biopolymer transporter ExbD [Flavobacterium sp.]|nr:biopolymer transporter ExbD [Flavobacterium sp.]